MQAEKMMYYPFVHPPRSVLWQALLYWDALTSIAPLEGYDLGRELEDLQDRELYQPAHADDLPFRRREALIDELRQVVVELPGRDLVPMPGPLGSYNRLYWGKLPVAIEDDLISLGALIPDGGLLRASEVLLSRLMVVLAKHLAAAGRGVIPFTDSPPAYEVAFAPVGRAPAIRDSWQLEIGGFLPIPAPDTPLQEVLRFREAYEGERKELATAVRKLLLSIDHSSNAADPDEAGEEIANKVREIQRAVHQLEKPARASRIIWMKRSLLVAGALGVAAASPFVPPLPAAILLALGSLGMGVVPVVTRPGVSTEFAYLQHVRSKFPDAVWLSAAP